MILSQPDLRAAIEREDIRFSPPLEDQQIGEASIDMRLGNSFTVFKQGFDDVTISVAKGLKAVGNLNIWATKELKYSDELGQPETYKLLPGRFVLALTYESVTVPRNMIARIEGRSTYARMGLSMHQTAPWIQPGWTGPIVLEIMNNGPLTVELTPMIDRPCQLTFFHLTSEVPVDMAYGTRPSDRYKDQGHPLVHNGKRLKT